MIKMGFAEDQAPYSSGTQNSRYWTESWVGGWAFCPSCGHTKLGKFPNNSPVADFYCLACPEQYELKSTKSRFGRRVVDGALGVMQQRLAANNNPNLFLLSYDRRQLEVIDMMVIPKRFFVPEIIEGRKPLSASARRAGWTGCNIVLERIPASGKIYLVQNKQAQRRDHVLSEWQRTLFLQHEGLAARGWLIEVMRCIESLGKRTFDLEEVYGFESRLAGLYPNNKHVREKIRQQLQRLRDCGYLDFQSRGSYTLRPPR